MSVLEKTPEEIIPKWMLKICGAKTALITFNTDKWLFWLINDHWGGNVTQTGCPKSGQEPITASGRHHPIKMCRFSPLKIFRFPTSVPLPANLSLPEGWKSIAELLSAQTSRLKHVQLRSSLLSIFNEAVWRLLISLASIRTSSSFRGSSEAGRAHVLKKFVFGGTAGSQTSRQDQSHPLHTHSKITVDGSNRLQSN